MKQIKLEIPKENLIEIMHDYDCTKKEAIESIKTNYIDNYQLNIFTNKITVKII